MSLKIWKASVLSQPELGNVGEIGRTFLTQKGGLAVQTRKDSLLIEELQLAGKTKINYSEFLKGRKNFIGKILQ